MTHTPSIGDRDELDTLLKRPVSVKDEFRVIQHFQQNLIEVLPRCFVGLDVPFEGVSDVELDLLPFGLVERLEHEVRTGIEFMERRTTVPFSIAMVWSWSSSAVFMT